jgi:aldose 1-epimerase
MSIEVKDFGVLPDGGKVELYVLENANGVKASITNYGGILVGLEIPDGTDIVLGYDDLAGYLADTSYHGATIGRYGNRIGGGKFELDGKVYELSVNENDNTLHGGAEGFDKRLWDAETFERNGASSVRLRLTSPDGDQGFPGLLEVAVVYTLTPENGLKIEYIADCEAPTVISMTHHSYFNLSGAACGKDVLNHELYIDSAAITPVNADLIPTGELLPVAGTPFDFNIMKKIGKDIADEHEQMKLGGGYDHNFILTSRDHIVSPAAIVIDPASGRKMEVFTTNPALQFYTGNFLDGTATGKKGAVYQAREGLCIEPQSFPDAPNKSQFPTTVLRPEEKYYEIIEYRFSTVEGK